MTEQDAVATSLAAELERRFPLTEKQLLAALQRSGIEIGLADVRRLLEDRPAFVLAGDRPRSWRLTRPSDAGTEVCAACGVSKSNSRFRTVSVIHPRCFDCEAHGRSAIPQSTAVRFDDPPFFIDGRAPTAGMRLTSKGAPGYVDPHEGLVYITKGGSAYHLREDCEALRSGQAEAIGTGHRLHRLQLVPRSKVTSDRHACSRCAS